MIGRGQYALIGLLAFAVKHNIDRFVAIRLANRPWSLASYWFPLANAATITRLPPADARFLALMVALSLPFVWIGVVLTVRRFRDVGLPLWLVVLFFAPYLNVVFFVALSILPSDTREPSQRTWTLLDRVIPQDALGSAAMAVLVTLVLGIAGIAAVGLFQRYGFGLFVALPFCLGLVAALIHGYHETRSMRQCQGVALLAVMFLGLAIVALAFEGVICLLMAMPIAIALASIGASIGYSIQRRPGRQAIASSLMLFIVVSVPGLMGAESYIHRDPPRYEVHTSLDIDAPPAVVWKSLVAFPRVAPPTEWLFRAGVAFPMEAWLRGEGVGAMRECLFSTGTFVEVIQAWDEGKLLQFSVAAQAPPMHELSPYPDVHPPHLDGYLHPEYAEFRLMPLPGGGTRLTGTSWYKNEMWPASYWRLWSDEIIHSVHRRVFQHVKQLSEHGRLSR